MLSKMHSTSALGVLLSCASQTSAWWILGCGNNTVVERLDPIVSPGALGGHVHTVMGGNAFTSNMTYETTQKSTCTTCVVSKDLSNYWVPTIYFHAQNGSFISVPQLGGANIYYQQRQDDNDLDSKNILAFPKGFRMLAGNPQLRTYNESSLAQRAISFACIPGQGSGGPATPGFPDHKCGGNLEIRVDYPMCWDGKNLDSADHRSHMAYPSGLDNGICPKTHPKRFMHLFLEVTFEVSHFDDLWYGDKQPFVVSNGDSTGYGYHGDFLNGWDVDLLQKAIDECTDNVSDVNKCPAFQEANVLQNATVQNLCSKASEIDEVWQGVLPALPGDNPV